MDITQRDWLRNSGWDRDKENMILIHGYGGSEDALPMVVLRDGKLKTLQNIMHKVKKRIINHISCEMQTTDLSANHHTNAQHKNQKKEEKQKSIIITYY